MSRGANRLTDSTELVNGYYYSIDIELLKSFIRKFLAKYKTIRVSTHASAIYEFENNTVECHSGGHWQRQLDAAMDYQFIEDTLMDMEGFITDPENFYQQESGGLFIRITNYWMNIYVASNGANNNDEQDDEQQQQQVENDEGIYEFLTPEIDSFLYMIGYASTPSYLIGRSGRRRKLNKRRKEDNIRNFLEQYNLHHQDPTSRIVPSTLSKWHEEHRIPHLFVFSIRGNCIYAKHFNDNYEEQMIYLKYNENTRKWNLIENLRQFLILKKKEIFCILCNRIHRENNCSLNIEEVEASTEKVQKNEWIPIEKTGLVIYADFESYINKDSDNQHFISGFSIVVIENRNYKHSYVYSGENADERFFQYIDNYLTNWQDPRSHIFESYSVQICGICEKALKRNESFVGPYRSYITTMPGLYHYKCWKSSSNNCFIYFHNFRSYDSHLLLRTLITRYETTNFLAKTLEKIDSCGVFDGAIKFVFKDSINYLLASLKVLGNTIQTYKFTPTKYQGGKDYFPYKWFDSLDKLAEPIPSNQTDWYSEFSLKTENESIDMEYIHTICEREGFHNFQQWHEFYNLKDSFILAEVFEKFRETAISESGVDPCYFYGAPSLTWYLAVNQCAEKMYTIKDTRFYKLIQQNIRGGVAQCCKRFVSVDASFDDYLLYLDINSLYSYCMMQKLPTKLINESRNLPDNWKETKDLQYFIYGDFEVDINKENEERYNLYKDLPPMPHKFDGRLCTTLLDKNDYLVSSVVLKFWLRHHIKIKKIHWVWTFECDYVLKDYVSANIEKRKLTTEKSKSDYYKLLNNSLYGKTCENKYKYRSFVKYVLETDVDEMPLQRRLNIFENELRQFIVINNQTLFAEVPIRKLILDKPIHLGFTILEYAKKYLFKFFYNLKFEFKDNLQLCYTDTDSLLLHFKNQEQHPIYQMKENEKIWRKLDIPKSTSYPEHTSNELAKTAGLWSDEVENQIISQFCGLRAKSYAILFHDSKERLKNKGIRRAAKVINKTRNVIFNDYIEVLNESKFFFVQQPIMMSKKHFIKTVLQKKLALTAQDFKRVVLSDGVNTEPYDYENIKYVFQQ